MALACRVPSDRQLPHRDLYVEPRRDHGETGHDLRVADELRGDAPRAAPRRDPSGQELLGQPQRVGYRHGQAGEALELA